MDFRERGYEDARWMELVQDCVQWRVFGISGFEPSGSVTAELVNCSDAHKSRQWYLS
jgi:hypothetical protein